MGLKIKEVIKEKGLTVQSLAERMGINRVGLSNHINGNPSVAVLEKIADALGVSIQELFEKDNVELNGFIEYKNEIFKINSFNEFEQFYLKIKHEI